MFMKEKVKTENMPKILQRIFNRYTHAAWVNDNNGGHCEPNIQKICESIIEMARRRVHEGVNLENSAHCAEDGVNNTNDAVDEAANTQYEMQDRNLERYRY